MLEKLTVAIKTIHRSWACHRLIQSLDRYAPGVKIHVLDDGHPQHRFSLHHPETAARVDQLTETEFDIGGSEGRNRLVDSVQTPYVLILDDDHVVIPQTDLAGLVAELDKHQDRCDLLGMQISGNCVPRCFDFDAKQRVVYLENRCIEESPPLFYCDIVAQNFVAKTDRLAAVRWDPELKIFEHWEIFWRAKKAGLRVALDTRRSIAHRHVRAAAYDHLRYRWKFKRVGLRKHRINQFCWHGRSSG